jgi:hypothetical protein
MATASPYIGRREAIGFGIETTPGTSVAPTNWMRWLDQDIQSKTTIVENDSAMGVVQKVNDSAIVEKFAEGKIGGKVTDVSIGYLLYGFFGTISNGAAVGGIYPHTFSTNASTIPTALTIGHVTPLKNQRYSYGTVESLEISAEAGGWVQCAASVKARVGATASDTPAVSTTELEFTSKSVTVKIAANVAGLGAALAVSAKSVKVTLERPSEAYFPLGVDDLPEFERGSSEVKGELVIRYTDTQFETDYLANTSHAMSIVIANGTTNLTLTASQVKYRELAKNVDKDKVVTATLQFTCEFDNTLGSAIVPVLNNATAAY